MPEIRLTMALKVAVLAGMLGGLAMGLFHILFTEPVIEKALAIEKAFATSEAEVVSRGLQKIGLLVGTVVLGAILGSLFAGPYALFNSWLPGSSQRLKGLMLTAFAYWSVAALPFFKYPANPPGVGEPETIAYRQTITLGFIALSTLGMAIAVAAYQVLGRRITGSVYKNRLYVVLIGYAVYASLLFVLMPSNPDKVRMPMELVWQFRVLSFAGQTILWLVLGFTFSLLWEHYSRRKKLVQRQVTG